MPVRTGIVIVGAGFGGIGMGIALKKAGYHDFVILEKDDDLGGTWRDNQYPGCACDVPSPLYSYSYELNPSWTRLFAPQQEIWDYLRICARKYGVDSHIRYGCAVAADGLGRRGRALAHRDRARRLPGPGRGVGRGRAAPPVLPGHPRPHCFARYRLSLRALGPRRRPDGQAGRGDRHRRSAIQFIPEIADRPARLRVFQRTAPWLHPRPDAPIPAGVRARWRPRRWRPGRCGTPSTGGWKPGRSASPSIPG